jgi:hypothetical protein
MAGYSRTPLWKKLGYKPGTIACVRGAPVNYRVLLELPPDVSVRWARRLTPQVCLVHFFTSSKSGLAAALRLVRKTIDPNGMIWISWPKKSSGAATDITEDTIREVALPLGLVDVKVCAIDEVWSGLKLMIRQELR